jgi:hypothetical protein
VPDWSEIRCRFPPKSPAAFDRNQVPVCSDFCKLPAERFVGTLVYPVADLDGATLTVREREADPRVTPPGLAWRLVTPGAFLLLRPPRSPAAAGVVRGVKPARVSAALVRCGLRREADVPQVSCCDQM